MNDAPKVKPVLRIVFERATWPMEPGWIWVLIMRNGTRIGQSFKSHPRLVTCILEMERIQGAEFITPDVNDLIKEDEAKHVKK